MIWGRGMGERREEESERKEREGVEVREEEGIVKGKNGVCS